MPGVPEGPRLPWRRAARVAQACLQLAEFLSLSAQEQLQARRNAAAAAERQRVHLDRDEPAAALGRERAGEACHPQRPLHA